METKANRQEEQIKELFAQLLGGRDYRGVDAGHTGSPEARELRNLLPSRQGQIGQYEWQVRSQDQLFNIKI